MERAAEEKKISDIETKIQEETKTQENAREDGKNLEEELSRQGETIKKKEREIEELKKLLKSEEVKVDAQGNPSFPLSSGQ